MLSPKEPVLRQTPETAREKNMEPLYRFEGHSHKRSWLAWSGRVRAGVHFGAQVRAGAFAGAGVPKMKLPFLAGIEPMPACLKG